MSSSKKMGIKPVFPLRFGCLGFLMIATASLATTASADDIAQCLVSNPFRAEEATYTICDRVIQNAATIDVDKAKALAQRGEAYYWVGQFQDSIADFDRALSISPELNETRIQRGWAHMRVGDVSGAYRDFTDAIEMDPKNGRAVFALAFMSRDPSVRRNGYEQALVFRPDYYLAEGALAQLDSRSPQTREAALKRYDRLLSLGEKKLNAVQFLSFDNTFYTRDYYTETLFNRALVLLEMKRFPESLKDLKEVQRLSSKEPMPYIKEAEVNLASKDYAAASIAAEKAVDICTRGSRPSMCGKAIKASMLANLHLGKSEEVIKRKGDVDNPYFDDFSRAYISLALAQAYKSLGKFDESRLAFKQVGELYPELLGLIVYPMNMLGYYDGTWREYASEAFWNGLEACFIDTKCVVNI
jgi:tetratricopeptide (TPR) repeat protein